MSERLARVNEVAATETRLVLRACSGQDAPISSPYMKSHLGVVTLDLCG